MGPDSGMALGIGIVMLLIVAGCFLVFLLLGRAVAQACGTPPRRAWAIGLVAAVIGLGLGLLAVGWTFYWSD